MRAIGYLAALAVFSLSGVALAGDVERCVDGATLAQSERDAGRLAAAYRELVACAQPSCPAPVATACAGWLADVEHRMPTLVFRVHDAAGVDLADVVVKVDGADRAIRLTGRPTPVDPGPHRLRFERADGTSVSRDVLLAEGEKNRLVVVAWPPPPPRPPAPSRAILPASSIVLGLAGVLALGVSAGFGLDAIGEARSLRRSCGPGCPEDERDGVARTLLVADVALAVGIVSLGLATWLALRHRSPQGASISTSSNAMSIP